MEIKIGILIMILFGLIQTILSVMLKRDKGRLCPLDRSQTIFKIGEMHESFKDCKEDIGVIKKDLEHGISVAERNTDHYNEFNKVLQNLVTYQKMLVDQQKETNKILGAIKRNGSG